MFGPGNAQLPSPPMLMFDRITDIRADGGSVGKGSMTAELDIRRDLWFFDCHFIGDPVMPGCLGLDAMWQLVGFYLAWSGATRPWPRPRRRRREVRRSRSRPTSPRWSTRSTSRRVILRRLVMGVADGVLEADGKPIYEAKDLRVGLYTTAAASGLINGATGETDVRRVVVTGLGIVSSIGADAAEVTRSRCAPRAPASSRRPEYAELGFRCQVHAPPKIADWTALVDRRAARFLAAGTAYAHIAMEQAIADAGLSEAEISNEMTGIIVGSGGASTRAIVEAADIAKTRGVKRIGPFAVPKANELRPLRDAGHLVQDSSGVNYSISSACATSTHCIGAAYEQIQLGKQDVMFAGGCEELDWTLSALFDAMGAMTSNFNATPDRASRPYDARTATASSSPGAAAWSCLEDYERAKARGATIHGEIVGYAANSDGHDMVAPSGEGAARCMRLAMAGAGGRKIDYLNTHGTGTPVGDSREIGAVRQRVRRRDRRSISSTKSLTGHSLGAAGVQEAIYCLLMMRERLHRRERQHRDPRPGVRRRAHSPGTYGSTAASTPPCPTASASAAPTAAW